LSIGAGEGFGKRRANPAPGGGRRRRTVPRRWRARRFASHRGSVCHHFIIYVPGNWCDDTGSSAPPRPARTTNRTVHAVVSKASREWEMATVTEQITAVGVKMDGRKRRWHQHKVERRNELVDGTIDAIRRLGGTLSMDEIAAEIGVSKTVLYRYFVDKNDLTTAVMMRFTQTTLIPNIARALTANLDGFDLTREAIRVYVETVANEPEPYRFVMANSSASKSKVIADSERIIARMLAVLMRRRMQQAGMDTGGAEPWAYLIVGGVQLATHSWMSDPRMTRDELIDYLTMLSWNALCGIVEVGGSLEKFREQPHPSPIVPPRDA